MCLCWLCMAAASLEPEKLVPLGVGGGVPAHCAYVCAFRTLNHGNILPLSELKFKQRKGICFSKAYTLYSEGTLNLLFNSDCGLLLLFKKINSGRIFFCKKDFLNKDFLYF